MSAVAKTIAVVSVAVAVALAVLSIESDPQGGIAVYFLAITSPPGSSRFGSWIPWSAHTDEFVRPSEKIVARLSEKVVE